MVILQHHYCRLHLLTFTWLCASDKIGGMGKAGKALRQVLEAYDISQNRLAVTMGIDRSTVHHWVKETRDPLANAIPDLVDALEKLNPAAAEEFLELYLGRSTQKDAE